MSLKTLAQDVTGKLEDELPEKPPTLQLGPAHKLARGLGWFSLALGAVETFAPRRLAEWLGVEGGEPLLRFYGVRELGAGAGALSMVDPAVFIWGRVAGDVLDIASLAAALRTSRRPGRVGFALANVAVITGLDLACAKALSRAR